MVATLLSCGKLVTAAPSLTFKVDADLAWHVPAHACNADAPVSDVCAVAAMLALNPRYGPSATRAPEFLIVQEVLVYDGPAAAGLFNVQIASTTAYGCDHGFFPPF